MGRGRKRYPLIEGLEITDATAEGKSMGRFNEKVVFVPFAVPGDIVNVQVTKKRKNYLEGRITKIVVESPQRIKAFCEYFGTCGGCKWQSMTYSDQLKFKQKQVVDNLTRIGKVELPEIPPILGSEKQQYYRNKLEFTFSRSRWITEEEIASGDEIAERRGVGFHIPGKFDKILDIDHCYLQGGPSNDIRNEIRRIGLDNELSFYNVYKHEGLLRNVIIRTANSGETMVVMSFGENDIAGIELVMEGLKKKFPALSSLMYVVNTKLNDSIYDQDILCYDGQDHIIEKMGDLQFKIGPKSFFQTNSEQALNLYQISADFADIGGDDLVYDLYTGTGSIAHFIAKKAKKVVGIESVPEAIEDAKVNATLNHISNCTFVAGDMMKILSPEFMAEHGSPDVIITDPPRAGMHEKVCLQLLACEAKTIVYVSCNPATQARDLALLDEKYKVTRVQPVDMFPHTHHVENVVKLELREA